MSAVRDAAAAATVTFASVLAAGDPLIRFLHRLKYGQTAYEDAPKTHAKKSGTPTMGGLLFLIPLGVATIVRRGDRATLALFVAGAGCGAVGFIDDYAKVVRKRNKGLGARDKFGLTVLVAAAFHALALPAIGPERRGLVLHAAGRRVVVAPAIFVSLGILAMLATTHAVNLTDGLDGLAGGTIVPPLLVVAGRALAAATTSQTAAMSQTAGSVATVDLALAASALGFLRFNAHPARVFMGDTGALALGGVLAGSAILMGNVLLLPLVGGVFVAEALSVIMQVAYFKRTGKRIFRMSPLHHHFELGGWPETKVTTRFWTASVLLSLAGAAVAE